MMLPFPFANGTTLRGDDEPIAASMPPQANLILSSGYISSQEIQKAFVLE